MKPLRARILTQAALIATLSGCGSENTPTPTPVAVPAPVATPTPTPAAPTPPAEPAQPETPPMEAVPEVATPLAMVSAPPDSELGLAQSAFGAGRFAEARAHYAAANAALEEAFDEEAQYEACEGETPDRAACATFRANVETPRVLPMRLRSLNAGHA